MNFRTKIFYRNSFKLLFKKSRTEKLSPDEEGLYSKTLYLCDWEDLVEWEYAVLDELNQKKKETGWLWFGKKQEPEIFVPSVYKDIYIPPPPESVTVVLTLACESVSLKLATYSIEKELVQSQSLNLSKTLIFCKLNDVLSSIKLSISGLLIEYQDLDSKDTLLRMTSQENLPSLKASLKLFTDLKVPNQIKYRSRFLEAYANPKAVSHLINFVSLKALSEANKKNIVDRLKQIQEKALNQLSDIFYYQKVYKITFSSPSVKVFVPSKSGVFVLSLEDLRVRDQDSAGLENYTTFDTGMTVEVLFNDLKIVPQFQVNLKVNTLNKIFLSQKWEMKESPFDSCYDICLSGLIENVQIYFYTILIDEFKYLETYLKFYETQELLILSKASIIKDAEKISTVTLNTGFLSQTCLAVLKNDTIYFFQNEKSQQAFNFCLLTGSTVSREENEISVHKSGKTITLKFSKENICERWFYLLLTKAELKIIPVLSQRYEKEVLKFDFAINQAQAFVISHDMVTQYHLYMGKQHFSTVYSDFVMEFSIKTESCSIKNKENEDIFYFGSEDSLESIDLKFFKNDSKFYKGQDIEIFVDFKSCHLFFSKSALAQLIAFQSSLVPKENPSNKVDENIMKIFFGYNISQICIDFFKDVREVGKFSLGRMAGKVLFEGSTAVLAGELASMQIMWKDKESGNYATLVDLADGINFNYGLHYQKDSLSFTAALIASQILYVPNIVKSVKGYFKELTSISPAKPASEPSTLVVKTEILIENFKFLAKKRLLHQQQFDFQVNLAKITSNNDAAQVELGKIQGNSSHLLFSHERTLVNINKNIIGVQSNDIGLYLTSVDLHYLINFFDPVVSTEIKQVKPFEVEVKVILENFSLQLLDNLNSFVFNSGCTMLELSGNEKMMTYGLSTQNSVCLFKDKEILKLLNDGSQVAFVQMSPSLLDINVSSLILNYDSLFISFFKEFIDITLAVEFSTNPNPVKTPYEYKVSLSSLLFCIDFNNIETKIESQLIVKYRLHTTDCEIDLFNFLIVNQDAQLQDPILNKLNLNLHLNFSESTSFFVTIADEVEVFINLENLNHFYNFYTQDFPKQPVSNNELVTYTKYQLNYSQITLNLLTKYREPFIKAVLKNDQFKGVISNVTELEIMSEISFDYFSPLLQEYECLMEPLEFQILYSYNIIPTPLSNLTISLVGDQKVSFCLTDTLLIDLYNRFYEKVPKIKHCSIYNNTGQTIQLEYSDLSIQIIEDQETEQIKSVKLGDYLSLAVILENNTRALLNRVPLYIEGIHSHTLINDQIDINTEITISGQSKLIKVSSPIEIKNNTQIQFQIIFFTRDSEPYTTKIIDPYQIISVPLRCCKGRVSFVPPNTDISKCKRVEFSTIIKESPFCKSGDFVFVLKHKKKVVHIFPSVSLKNALPTYISVSVGAGGESLVQPNEFIHYYVLPEKVSLNLTVNGFNRCKAIMMFDKKISKKVPLSNNEYSTEIGLLYNEEDNLEITFYPHYLISNLSLIPLSFLIPSKGSFVDISKNYRNNKFFIGKVESLKVAVGDVASNPLNIDSMNKVPFEVKSKNSIFHFVHETITAKLPGVNRFTKIFCVYSRVMVTNLMEQDVRIIQTETNEQNFTFLKSKQRNYFNWATYNRDLFLVSIRVDKVSTEWSGGFSLNESDTFYVKIENPTQRFFVKVDVKDQNGIISVFFYNSYESDLKITNLCSFDIQAYQQDYPVPMTIPVGTFDYFAWHSKSLKQVLTLKFKALEFSTKVSVDFSLINKLLQFPLEDDPSRSVFVMIYKEANSHNVVVSETPIEEYQKPYPSLRFSLKFPTIFLSFIQQDIYKKQEVMLLSLTNLVFNITQYGQSFEWKIALTDLQFDSQIDKFVVCPIFFVSDGDQDLTVTGKIVTTSKWMCLEDLNIDMKNFVVNADSNLIESVLDYYKRFFTEITSSVDALYTENFEALETQSNAWIFLSQLKISSFVIRFSYKNLPNNFQDHFKSYLINFDDIMVFLEMTSFAKIYGSPSTIMNTLTSAYRTMIMSNVDLILKQHGMIGGALMLALKFSNGIAKIGKKSKQQKESQRIYKERLKNDKNITSMKFTRCLKTADLNSKTLNKLQGKDGVDTFAEIINNPVNGFLNLFKPKKKRKSEETANVVIKYKQRPNRVFYGRFSLIKPFNFEDCEAVMTIKELNPDYCNFFFYGQVTGTDIKSQNKLKFVVFDQIVILLGHENKVLWEIVPIFIESAQPVKETLIIRGADKKGKTVEHSLCILEKELLEKARDLIKEVKRDINN